MVSTCIDHGQVGKKVKPKTEHGKFTGGYGKTCRAFGGKPKRSVNLHRAVYCDANGITLDAIVGKTVLHTCDNPRCINPEHLELGDRFLNNIDMLNKGRGVSIAGVGSRGKYATKL